MSANSDGEEPPDPGLSAVGLAITSSTQILNNQDIEMAENDNRISGYGEIQIVQGKPKSCRINNQQEVSKTFKNINQQLNKSSIVHMENVSSKNTQNLAQKTSDKSVSDHTQEIVEKERQIYLFSNSDTGPYSVYIENSTANFTGKLSAMKIGETVYQLHPELDNQIKNIDSIGRNRIRINFKNSKSANALVKSAFLKQYNLIAYIPKFLLHRRGVVKYVDLEYTEEQLKNSIKEYDMHCKFTVESVKRFNRKETLSDGTTKLSPTKTILINFKSQSLPKCITINHVIFSVETYNQKVLLCYNCYRYGHLGKQCRSSVRCLKCGENHESKTCNKILTPRCFHCAGNHFTNEIGNCPEFKRQTEIKKVMSDTNISYRDACGTIKKSTYADILTSDLSLDKYNSSLYHCQTNSPKPRNPTPSSHFTQIIRRPTKRPCPASPDPILESHRQIIQNESLPSTPGGITHRSEYRMALETDPSRHRLTSDTNLHNNLNHSDILNIIIFIINTLKEKNTFDIQESELLDLIKIKCINSSNK